jgi:hypothetical protein
MLKVVCSGLRGGIAADGDGQNASVIRLPGYTGYGCGFRFTVMAVWSPGVNTLVQQVALARIETA